MIDRLTRQERIRSKGFDMSPARQESLDFSKIKVGIKKLQDATLEYGNYKRVNPTFANKENVIRAIQENNLRELREISNFYFKTSGIYARLCKYMAYLYKYDWLIIPVMDKDKIKNSKVEKTFMDILRYCENFELKSFFNDVSLKVIRNGCYYGYIIKNGDSVQVQELLPNYCRSRYKINGKPVVEFNMRFFLDYAGPDGDTERLLKIFPKDFKKGFEAFKAGRLQGDFPGDTSGWYLLDPECTVKFNLNDSDYPSLIAVIPAVIDLDNAQGLDRKKLEQQLLKIIIQKMPIDKNGDLVFDIDEARALHNNAVSMVGDSVGLSVLTTFADVDVADMAESSNTTSDDTMDRIKHAVYAQSGVSMNQFDSENSVALEKSIANDEATMYPLVLQFESFINKVLLKSYNTKPKKQFFKAQILPTTIYNYKDLAKLYKEQTQLGYSKFLPQVALGQSQLAILSSAYFENDLLKLSEVFIPPAMSSTTSAASLTTKSGNGASSTTTAKTTTTDSEGAGRKELDNDKKSDKTIANIESKGNG